VITVARQYFPRDEFKRLTSTGVGSDGAKDRGVWRAEKGRRWSAASLRGGCGGGLGFNADVRSLTRISHPANGFSPKSSRRKLNKVCAPSTVCAHSPSLYTRTAAHESRSPSFPRSHRQHPADAGRSLTSTAPELRRCVYMCGQGPVMPCYIYIRTILVTVIIITLLLRTTICYV